MIQKSDIEIFVLAVGLAMDATAVAAARGVVAREVRVRDAVKLAAFFGGFQAGMPFLGFLLGAWLGSFVAAWSHWIAFVLLAGIGAKMIHEARGHRREEDASSRPADPSPFRTRVVLVLAIATSIDAFAVGVTLSMLHAPLLLTLVVIGVTTAVLTVAGLYAGRRFGAMLGPRLELLGGVVIVAIGAKILFDHFRAS